MIILRELELIVNSEKKAITFGQPNTEEELEEILKLRYKIYSERGYINPNDYKDGKEYDEYDKNNQCAYFIARIDNKIIGTIRLIKSTPLPTEKDFTFETPTEIAQIPRKNLGELGRFIIIPLDKEKGNYLPRGIVMLLMISSLIDYGVANSIEGGYSFIKKSLEKKMKNFGFPIHKIKDYKLQIGKANVLYRYYTQPENPVIPIFFLTKEFKKSIDKIIAKKWLFSHKNGKIILRNNIGINLLRFLKFL